MLAATVQPLIPTRQRRTIAAALQSRNNNFDCIRLLAALLVIYSHSFPVLRGVHYPEPLLRFSGVTSFGELAVAIFFIISGLLIARSYQSDPRPMAYLSKRCLRIFPGLIACTLLCIFVVGPLCTTCNLHDYFTQRQTWAYLCNSFMWSKYDLPGVFRGHPMTAVNGSLWSLGPEFIMYLVVLALGLMGRLNRRTVIAIMAFLLLVRWQLVDRNYWSIRYLHDHDVNIRYMADLGFLFLAGTLMLLYKERIVLDGRVALGCLFLLAAACYPAAMDRPEIIGARGRLVLDICLPYLVIYLAFAPLPWLRHLTRWGDFSYGSYLYAFPVQQMVLQWTHGRLGMGAFVALCTLLTLVLAVLSWFIVEKPLLRLKSRTSRPVGQIVGVA